MRGRLWLLQHGGGHTFHPGVEHHHLDILSADGLAGVHRVDHLDNGLTCLKHPGGAVFEVERQGAAQDHRCIDDGMGVPRQHHSRWDANAQHFEQGLPTGIIRQRLPIPLLACVDQLLHRDTESGSPMAVVSHQRQWRQAQQQGQRNKPHQRSLTERRLFSPELGSWRLKPSFEFCGGSVGGTNSPLGPRGLLWTSLDNRTVKT